jgi:hypothetical protein
MHSQYVVFIALFVFHHFHVGALPAGSKRPMLEYSGNKTKGLKTSLGSNACIYDSDCNVHQQCRNRSCICEKGWVSWRDEPDCSYEQKPKWPTFFISLFLGGLGTDWFYLARGKGSYIVAGIFKLIMSAGCCSSASSAGRKVESRFALNVLRIGYVAGGGGGIWWLVDWIRILSDAFSDGNGISLA